MKIVDIFTIDPVCSWHICNIRSLISQQKNELHQVQHKKCSVLLKWWCSNQSSRRDYLSTEGLPLKHLEASAAVSKIFSLASSSRKVACTHKFISRSFLAAGQQLLATLHRGTLGNLVEKKFWFLLAQACICHVLECNGFLTAWVAPKLAGNRYEPWYSACRTGQRLSTDAMNLDGATAPEAPRLLLTRPFRREASRSRSFGCLTLVRRDKWSPDNCSHFS